LTKIAILCLDCVIDFNLGELGFAGGVAGCAKSSKRNKLGSLSMLQKLENIEQEAMRALVNIQSEEELQKLSQQYRRLLQKKCALAETAGLPPHWQNYMPAATCHHPE